MPFFFFNFICCVVGSIDVPGVLILHFTLVGNFRALKDITKFFGVLARIVLYKK